MRRIDRERVMRAAGGRRLEETNMEFQTPSHCLMTSQPVSSFADFALILVWVKRGFERLRMGGGGSGGLYLRPEVLGAFQDVDGAEHLLREGIMMY